MDRLRSHAAWLMLGVGLVVELLLVTSIANHYRYEGREFGAWGIEMGPEWSQAFSWTAVIFVALAFVRFWGELRFAGMAVTLGAAGLFLLLWGRDLPNPQDEWQLALAFLLGALTMFVEAVRRTDFLSRARGVLGRIVGH